MSVSVTAGLLDLFAPKFGMDGLGVEPGEKITIRVTVSSKDGQKRMILFGTYAIRGRHTQISSQGLSELGPEVDVISVERYALKNFVEDVSKILADNPLIGEPEIRWENGKIWFVIGGKSLPVTLQSIYVAAARIFAVLECQGKRMKVALGDEVEIFDGSRRKLSGMRLKGEKLILERAFQNLETARPPS